MIQTLVQHFKENIPSVGRRVQQPFLPKPKGAPYITFVTSEASDLDPKAYIKYIEVYIYDEPGSFINIERITDELLLAMQKDIAYDDLLEQGFIEFELDYISPFHFDESLQMNTNGPIRFNAHTLRRN